MPVASLLQQEHNGEEAASHLKQLLCNYDRGMEI